ncbi:MAG: acetyl-CoA carboxylase biotin carboxyl carrier protein [Candidatus Aminicenantes bacterium]|nr:acetyl-CoA carboxylase biotin carboxyl carrier protein [Candidatus Aminicenantes bacterium]
MKSKIDYKEVTKLIDLLEERDLSEFELEVEGFKIKISRSPKGTMPAQPHPAPVISPENKSVTKIDEIEPDEETDELHIVRSPMVGTFYRAPDPSSQSFVEIGESVQPGQTVCIIEAMKLMNEIESDIDGVIEKIYVENGKTVEYGQKLFGIKSL